MSYTRQFDPGDYRDTDLACAWLVANGIQPDYIPTDARITLDRRNMTIDVYLAHDGRPGKPCLDAHGDIMRGTITVPIRRRPPVLASLGPARRKRHAGTIEP